MQLSAAIGIGNRIGIEIGIGMEIEMHVWVAIGDGDLGRDRGSTVHGSWRCWG
jgi:hypothetical protein